MPFKTRTAKREYHKRYQKLHPEKRRAASTKWRLANPEKFKAKIRKHNHGLKDKAYEKLGRVCANISCGWVNADGTRRCTDERCLQLDHIDGNGNADRKAGIHTAQAYKAVIEGSTTYQLLCANCNWIKKVESHQNKS